MTPQLSSARIGSGGGISVPMHLDTAAMGPDLQAGLSTLRQQLSMAEKTLKASPKVTWDFAEAAFQREMRKAIRMIEGQGARVRVQAELDSRGLSTQIRAAVSAASTGVSANFDRGSAFATSNGFDLARRREMQIVPGVAMSPELASRASLRAARAQHQERQDVEARLAGEDGGSSLDALGRAVALRRGGGGSARAAATGGSLDLLARASLTGYSIHAGLGIIGGLGDMQYTRAAANSSSPEGRIQGQLATIEAGKSMPIVGELVTVLDKLSGATRDLTIYGKATAGMREQGVGMAALTRVPSNLIAAAGASRITGLKAEYSGQGYDVDSPYAAAEGTPLFAARQHVASVQGEESAKLNRSKLEQRLDILQLGRGVEQAELARNRRPLAAQRAQIIGEGQDAAQRADRPDLVAAQLQLMAKRLQVFDTEVRRNAEYQRFDADTAVGQGEATHTFKGGTLYANTYGRLRAMQARIERSNNENGERDSLRLAGISEARGMSAQLAFQSGGVSHAVNIGLGGAPDALTALPIFKEQMAAMRSTKDFIAGQIGYRNTLGTDRVKGGGTGELDETVPLLKDIKNILEKLSDNPKGAVFRALPN